MRHNRSQGNGQSGQIRPCPSVREFSECSSTGSWSWHDVEIMQSLLSRVDQHWNHTQSFTGYCYVSSLPAVHDFQAIRVCRVSDIALGICSRSAQCTGAGVGNAPVETFQRSRPKHDLLECSWPVCCKTCDELLCSLHNELCRGHVLTTLSSVGAQVVIAKMVKFRRGHSAPSAYRVKQTSHH